MKITIIGVGNIGGAIARGLSQGSIFKASDISCADMSEELLKRMTDFNPDFKVTTKAEEVVAGADILIVAVKPWRVESVFDQIKDYLNLEKQIIISIAAGVTFQDLQRILSILRLASSMRKNHEHRTLHNTSFFSPLTDSHRPIFSIISLILFATAIKSLSV